MRTALHLVLITALLTVACGDDPTFVVDQHPVVLQRAPVGPGMPGPGALLARARGRDGADVLLLVDTSFPPSSLQEGSCSQPGGHGQITRGDLEILDGGSSAPTLRAALRNLDLFDLCLSPVGDGSIRPGGVIGGSTLAGLSVQMSLPLDPGKAATVTFHEALDASETFLSAFGYAVIRFRPRGALDLVVPGQSGVVRIPPTRVVLRACVGPEAFDVDGPRPVCPAGTAAAQRTGVDLLLAVGTGVGPLVLSESAWRRVADSLGLPAGGGAALPLHVASLPQPVPARWVKVPRLALVNRDDGSNGLGPCAGLARARRLRWAAFHQAEGACIEPCDSVGTDAAVSAAHLELGGELTAAVVDDRSEVLRGLNMDTPLEPLVDGLIGAGTLAGTRFEIDQKTESSGRFVVSCDPTVPADRCRTSARCPRLSDPRGAPVCFEGASAQPVPLCAPP